MFNAEQVQMFVDAQNSVYADVTAELKAGRKTSHWMWFIFPQLTGLGSSTMARRFALSSMADARAFLDHPVLGRRLRECTRLLLDLNEQPIERVLGSPDDLKFRSSMTLFAAAAPNEALFPEALEKYFHGERDPKTVELLGGTN